MAAQTHAVKVGPWGASEGKEFDITEPPKRLLSMTVYVNRVIAAIAFTYVDLAGKKHIVGPFGAAIGEPTTIEFAPREYVIELSGTFSPVESTSVVTSLKIKTNFQTHEMHYYKTINDFDFGSAPENQRNTADIIKHMWAQEKKTYFSIPLPENFSIVGFFGRADVDLDAIGVYVKQTSSSLGEEIGPVKIGKWGGDEGTTFDVTQPSKRLESMTIRSGNAIDSFGFSFVDQAGQKYTLGPYGGTGGPNTALIELAPGEYVKNISGTTDGYGPESHVASLQIETNTKTYGPYGKASSVLDDSFSIPLPEDVSVVGFFGRAGGLLDAIGIYVCDSKSTFTDAAGETSSGNSNKDAAGEASGGKAITAAEASPIKIGLWGSYEGTRRFDVEQYPKRLESVIIRAGEIIDSFGFTFVDQGGQKETVGPVGGKGGSLITIELEPSEYVIDFRGTTGIFKGSWVIASLRIETNFRTYGPYGKGKEFQFSVPLPENAASIVGFYGYADYKNLEAIGVYVSGSIPK